MPGPHPRKVPWAARGNHPSPCQHRDRGRHGTLPGHLAKLAARVTQAWNTNSSPVRAPVAKELLFVGSVKWLESSPFDRHDLAALVRHRAALTPEPVPQLAASRGRTDCEGLTAEFGPADLLTAWRP